jgi:hypothetical protein
MCIMHKNVGDSLHNNSLLKMYSISASYRQIWVSNPFPAPGILLWLGDSEYDPWYPYSLGYNSHMMPQGSTSKWAETNIPMTLQGSSVLEWKSQLSKWHPYMHLTHLLWACALRPCHQEIYGWRWAEITLWVYRNQSGRMKFEWGWNLLSPHARTMTSISEVALSTSRFNIEMLEREIKKVESCLTRLHHAMRHQSDMGRINYFTR